MPLQFIFGPSGSGKSHYLYQHIIKESSLYPKQNFIVLVPEQFTMQTQKDLVTAHPNKGIMNIDVLSFGRLAYRIFEETGGGSLPVLDDEGKNLILRKIAADYEKELIVLRGNMKKLGYISEVKSIISEFTQYDIGEEQIEKVMETVGEESGLYYKLQDIKLLYRGFTEFLKEKFITKEELLDVLSKMVGQSDILKNSTVVLDGFTGFTPVQNRLLSELMRNCRKVIVTVTMDVGEDPYTYQHPYQLFGIGKQMVASLVDVAKQTKSELLDAVNLNDIPVYRFRENEPLSFLERNLFRYRAGSYEGEQEAVSVHVARNPKEESLCVAGNIRKLVRERGYRYRDIGVIVSDMEVYADYLEQAFGYYDIPVFMDHKRSILLNSFVEYIRSILNMTEQGFTYESVFRFLRTDMSGFLMDDVDRLENYILALGVKGYKKWQERWIRRPRGMSEEDLDHLNHCRVRFVEKVDALVLILRKRKKTVQDITVALYEFMARESAQTQLKRKEEEFIRKEELALAREYAQIYRIVLELFDKFVSLLGEEEVSLGEYCKLLDAGLEEARVGVIPPSVDQVVIGDVERTRLKDIKVLLFVGANDSHLPGASGQRGMLSERDRQHFMNERLALSPGGKEKAYIQKFYLYMNLTKPSELLEIYYSKVSLDGKTNRPAYLVQEVKRLFPGLVVEDEEGKSLYEKEITQKTAISMLIDGLLTPAIQAESTWRELYSFYKRDERWQNKLQALLEAGYMKRMQDSLTKDLAQRLYGEDFEESITRMERFASCAFSHFITYGLRLKERQEYDFRPLDMGNVCHVALEKYGKKVNDAQQDWTKIGEEQQRLWMEESVEEAISDYGNAVLYSSARNEYTIQRIKKMLHTTVWALTNQLAAGDFHPASLELRFANGKIDRVDVCEDGDQVYVKVVDYKTGTKEFDIVSLYHGLQLQLMVYMDAAVKLEEGKHSGKEVIPAGVFYYRIMEPLVDKGDDDNTAAVLKELKPDGIINLKSEVLSHLDRSKQEESCYIPVKYNKNGSLSKSSKVLSEEDFKTLMEYAVERVAQTRERIVEGEVAVKPYRRGQQTGCDYCDYRHICGFDGKIPGFAYHDMDKMSKEEAIAAMKGEKESWESRGPKNSKES